MGERIFFIFLVIVSTSNLFAEAGRQVLSNGALRDRITELDSQCLKDKQKESEKARACYKAGIAVLRAKESLVKDFSSPSIYLVKACKLKHARACNIAGLVLEKMALPTQARFAFSKGCKLKLPEACFNGAAFLTKIKDTDAAIDYYKRGCELGNHKSCYNGGVILAENDKIVQALYLWDKACKGGFFEACDAQGVSLLQAKKPKEAAAVFEKACSRGNVESCVNLARVAKETGSSKLASELAVYACGKAHWLGCSLAGLWSKDYGQGSGYLATARPLINRACAKGVKKACKMIDEIAKYHQKHQASASR